MNWFYLLVALGVAGCSCSQIILKKSATEQHDAKFGLIANRKVLLAYSIFLLSVFVNTIAVGYGVKVKDLPIIESLGYVIVPLLSYFFLGESFSKRLMLSVVLIISGVCVFYL